MAVKAPPKQRYRYTLRWREVFSEREQIAVWHRTQTSAYSDDQAKLQIRKRLAQRGLYVPDEMVIEDRIPTAPRRTRRPPAPMAKTPF